MYTRDKNAINVYISEDYTSTLGDFKSLQVKTTVTQILADYIIIYHHTKNCVLVPILLNSINLSDRVKVTLNSYEKIQYTGMAKQQRKEYLEIKDE